MYKYMYNFYSSFHGEIRRGKYSKVCNQLYSSIPGERKWCKACLEVTDLILMKQMVCGIKNKFRNAGLMSRTYASGTPFISGTVPNAEQWTAWLFHGCLVDGERDRVNRQGDYWIW